MPQSLDFVPVHFVFSTRNRRPDLDLNWARDCYAVMAAALDRGGARLVTAGGVPDHVHLLISQGRVSPLSELVKLAKYAAHAWITSQNLVPDFAWQRGYAAFGVGLDGLPAVQHYINHQAEHHAAVSFQDECRELLTRHGLEFDERYVWD